MAGLAEQVATPEAGDAGKASAPEYQGALGALSVNASLTDVLARGIEELRAAEAAGDLKETARCHLAVAEAEAGASAGPTRPTGRGRPATARPARQATPDPWPGPCGAAAPSPASAAPSASPTGCWPSPPSGASAAATSSSAATRSPDSPRPDASRATTRPSRNSTNNCWPRPMRRGEARHTVWALEGIAQMHRNTGAYDRAHALFAEAAEIAERAEDHRGWAWALRGMADVVSVRDGDVAQALALLTRAEAACQAMDLRGALAFNHKMRGNVLYRAYRYEEARDLYTRALAEFRDMTEPRGTALSRLGLAKARARLGRDSAETAAELATLRDQFNRIGLHHAREMVDKAAAELGVGPLPGPGTAAATPPDAYRTEALRATDVAGLR